MVILPHRVKGCQILKKLFVALLLCLGLLTPFTPRVADAVAPGYYLPDSVQTCDAVFQYMPNTRFICADLYQQQIYVNAPDGGYIWFYTLPISPSKGAYPTRPWVSPDANCNSVYTQFGWNLTFTTGDSYGYANKVMRIQELYYGAPNPGPWTTAIVPKSATEMLAWWANSNAGYVCVVAN